MISQWSHPPPGTVAVRVGAHQAFVDEADYDRVASLAWRPLRRRNGTMHAIAHGPGKHGTTITMHRTILGIHDPDVLIYHADGNGLHNWRPNLRIYRKVRGTGD